MIGFSSGSVSCSDRLSLGVSGGRLESYVLKEKHTIGLSEFIPEHGAVPSFLCIQSYLARITDYIECHFIFAMSYALSQLEIEFKI